MKNQTLRFGDVVCWYRNATTQNAPQLATVYHVNDEGNGRVSLTLAVTIKDAERVEWFSGVHHVNDPVYQTRPRGANMAKSNGGFEYREEFEKRIEERQKKLAEDQELERMAREEQIAKSNKKPVAV